MTQQIRRLHANDYYLFAAMDTGIENDYVSRVFHRLIAGNNFLYGLFIDNQLASVGGYTVYAKQYAMLGRLRSDRRYRGNDLATKLMSHVVEVARQQKDIVWIGANTQEDNLPAQRVLDKINLLPQITLHGAITKDVSALTSDGSLWTPIHDLKRKKDWLENTFIQSEMIFPYECYYPFPASEALFKDEEVDAWRFYENDEKTRYVIIKPDQKKHVYLHMVYPWSDFTEQTGLWETVEKDFKELTKATEEETYIWVDVTKEEAKNLPEGHAFELPSPWILYGKNVSMHDASEKIAK